MKILDATCGSKSIWYQKNHPFVIYLDKRNEKINIIQPNNILKNKRIIKINPNIVADFQNLPFRDNCFDVLVFDPPHIIRKRKSKPHTIKSRYGYFLEHNYKTILRNGIADLFRVLKPKGVFILKWCDLSTKVDEILKLFPYKPLFGTRTGQSNKSHWILFIKHSLEKQLDEFGD